MMRGLWLAALCWVACGSNQAPADAPSDRPRGVFRDPQAAVPPPAATPQQPAAAPTTVEDTSADPAKPSAGPEEEAEDEAKRRDYGAELLAALGTPAECLHERSGDGAPSELKIDIQAYVLDSGFVSRAYARSPLLDEAELQCLSKRAGALHLTAPIEDAPRAVSTTLTLTLKVADKPVVADKPGADRPAEIPEKTPETSSP